MQNEFIEKWNAARKLLPEPQARTFPELSSKGECVGFSFTYLYYAKYIGTDKYFQSLDMVLDKTPQELATLMSSKTGLAKQLQQFATTVNRLSTNQRTKLQENQGASAIASNALRIGASSGPSTKITMIKDENSASDLFKDLQNGEGYVLDAEWHAYAIRKSNNRFEVVDVNASRAEAERSFDNIADASRYLVHRFAENAGRFKDRDNMSFLDKIREGASNLMNKVFPSTKLKLITQIAELPLIATKVSYGAENAAQNNDYLKMLTNLSDTTDTDCIANLAIRTDRVDILENLSREGKFDACKDLRTSNRIDEVKAPLHTATTFGSMKCMRYLLENGADPKRASVLHAAVEYHYPEMVKLLLDAGADPNEEIGVRDRTTLLRHAVKLGNEDVVKILLDKGADPNKVINDYRFVTFDMDQGTSYTTVIDDHTTALMDAAAAGDLRLCALLLRPEYKANINLQDKEGRTALMMAAMATQKGASEVVELLLAKNANPDLVDRNGHTALQLAQQNGQHKIVSMLSPADEVPAPVDIAAPNGQELGIFVGWAKSSCPPSSESHGGHEDFAHPTAHCS